MTTHDIHHPRFVITLITEINRTATRRNKLDAMMSLPAHLSGRTNTTSSAGRTLLASEHGPPYSMVGEHVPCNVTDLLSLSNCSADAAVTAGTVVAGDDVMAAYRPPLIGTLLSLFALITVLGNLLVIAAVARERYLRSVTNYFIVSLAIADFIIGAVVMPFSITLEASEQLWLFGADWCDVWHSFDVLASTASILNLSVISLDRYWAITDPIAYPNKMATGKAFVLIALVWICSAAISFPAILWWRAVASQEQQQPPSASEHVCFFTDDSGYLIFSSIISFYVPMTVILYAYYRIYRAATEQIRSLKVGSKVMHHNGVNGEAMTLRMHRGGRGNVQYSRTSINSDSEAESPAHLARTKHVVSALVTCHASEDDIRPSRMISRKWRHFAISRKLSKLAKEQKAAKTLGIVMGVFCICWVPFFVTNVLYGICKLGCVKKAEILFPVFTWLGYINSGMNPIIYAFSMRDFRRAFVRILCCCCPNYFRVARRRHMCETSFSTSSIYVSGHCHERYANIRL